MVGQARREQILIKCRPGLVRNNSVTLIFYAFALKKMKKKETDKIEGLLILLVSRRYMCVLTLTGHNVQLDKLLPTQPRRKREKEKKTELLSDKRCFHEQGPKGVQRRQLFILIILRQLLIALVTNVSPSTNSRTSCVLLVVLTDTGYQERLRKLL